MRIKIYLEVCMSETTRNVLTSCFTLIIVIGLFLVTLLIVGAGVILIGTMARGT
jgi:hypothetical protein